MSCLEVLPAQSLIDFDLSVSARDRNHAETIIRSSNDGVPHSLINVFFPTSPPTRSIYDFHHHKANEGNDIHIPHLPPLLRGHPDIHLRNGVMRAARLAATHEPDAEKAFFVADLSYVYKQHERWMQCLPGVEPFYGKISFW